MSVQDTLNNVAARLSSVSDQLARGLDEVRGKIAELENQVAAGGAADFTAVNAALEAVSSQAQALDNVVPEAVSVDETPVDETPVEPVDVPVDSETPTENV